MFDAQHKYKNVQVRLALRSDLPRLEWAGELVHFRNIFAEAFRNSEQGTGLIWIVEFPGDGLIGQAIISLQSRRQELSDGGKRAYLYGFRVRPEFRNHGVGTLILQTIEADLIARGFRILTLNVAKENSAAQKLYQRLGFQIVSSEPGEWYYLDHEGHRQDVHEPAWRMEKLLS
jgi:ribosomal protein S18 acetylase RimI-like enzyme